MSNVFDVGASNISIAVDVLFPSNVMPGNGVGIEKDGANWTMSLDYPPLTENTNPTILSQYDVAIYDRGADQYERLRLDNLIGTATGLDTRQAVGDAAYIVQTKDRYIGLTAALTVNRAITLPAASAVPGGREIVLQDEVGGLSPSRHWTVNCTGADTIDGKSSRIIGAPFGGARLRSDGTNRWSVVADNFVTPTALSYTATAADRNIAVTAVASSLTVTLPQASTYPPGQRIVVFDQSGQCAAGKTITVAPFAGDLINGSAAPTAAVLNAAYLYIGLVTDGSTQWTIVDGGVGGAITVSSAQITDASPLGRTLLTNTTASADRASLGSGAVGDAIFVSTTTAAAQTAIGLSAGTSGHTLPYLDGVNAWSGAQTYSAPVTFANAVFDTGAISPAALAANVNDYAPTGFAGCNKMRLTSTSAVSITGLAGGAAGRRVDIINVGTNNIVLTNQSVASTPANQFNIGANITIGAQQAVELWYDGTTNCWEALAAPGTGGGGAAGALLAVNNLSDVNSVTTSRSNLGLGSIATQAASAVAITGGTIDATPIGATTKAAGNFTNLTADSYGPIITTQPRYIHGLTYASNVGISCSVASNALTVTLTAADGSALSATNPAVIPIRNDALTLGISTQLLVTSNLSCTAPAGATFGIGATTSSFRLWLAVFNDAGTPRLGLVQTSYGVTNGSSITCIGANGNGTTIAISSGSTGGGQWYGPVAISTARGYCLIGYLDFPNFATLGNWTAIPTRIQLCGPGICYPGQVMRQQWQSALASTASSTSSSPSIAGSVVCTKFHLANYIRFTATWFGEAAPLASQSCEGVWTINDGAVSYGSVYLATLLANAAAVGQMYLSNTQYSNSQSITFNLTHAIAAAATGTVYTGQALFYFEELMV